ncbi:hypothetical protein MMC32_006396 [Xylographa parallela]|nr:hypothetical protein [Xylographa parallela]
MSADAWKSVPFPVPTLDRPFGVELWPIFEKLWMSFRTFAPQDFQFVSGTTPMSTLKETAAVLVSYYIIVFGGRELMKNRPAFKFNPIFMAHNLGLTIISGGLLALFIEQLLPTVRRNGVFFAICNADGGWTRQLVTLYYLNYITKYLELFDTVFLVLKKKPLTFLHTYHHGATALLCYTQLVGLTPISWVPITLNLLVHVVMYWYYFQSARGIRIWWKEWITRLQIAQFIIDLGFVYFATYTYFTSTYFQWMPNAGKCAGEEFAAVAGCCILSSYLVLFISFYIATYKKPHQKGRKRRDTATRAAIDMSKFEVPTVDSISHGSDGILGNGDANASGRSTNGSVTRSRKA